jgi:hypothetical protein
MNYQIDRQTLVLIPCCARKAPGGLLLSKYHDPLGNLIPSEVYGEVIDARRQALAKVDTSLPQYKAAMNLAIQSGPDFGGTATGARYLPAIERYQGTLYSVPGLRGAITNTLVRDDSPQVLILSALYGPLHPLSPIQDYNLRMEQPAAGAWRRAFPAFLARYVQTYSIRRVLLFVGTSTAYFRVGGDAATNLLRAGLIEEATQFHVVDGSTRATPLEHGRLLHALLTTGKCNTNTVQPNRLAGGSMYRSTPMQPLSPPMNEPGLGVGPRPDVKRECESGNAQKPGAGTMRRAPRPTGLPMRVSSNVGTALRATSPPPTQAVLPHKDVTRIDLAPTTVLTHPVEDKASNSVMASTLSSGGNLNLDRARFYNLLDQLYASKSQGKTLSELIESGSLSERGVYFFVDQEADMKGHRGRICRIGTHAVSIGSKSTLRARLKTHLGSRSGMGNHRGSIFRLHVGNALLRRDGEHIPTWGVGSSAPPSLRVSEELQLAERRHENRVSNYIGSLRVLWVDVPDTPGPNSERSYIERNAIALLSNRRDRGVVESGDWLGQHSPREEIRSSQLWNLNYVGDNYDSKFLTVLERAVALTLKNHGN